MINSFIFIYFKYLACFILFAKQYKIVFYLYQTAGFEYNYSLIQYKKNFNQVWKFILNVISS